MKRHKLSETQIVTMLNEAESGAQINELCRRYQISAATYYKLKNRYSGMSISELMNLFDNLEEVENLTKEWIQIYNLERPHESLNGLAPVQFAEKREETKNLNHSTFI